MKRIHTLMMLLVVFALSAMAQSPQQEYEAFRQKEMGNYTEFKRISIESFANALRKNWEEFKAFEGVKPTHVFPDKLTYHTSDSDPIEPTQIEVEAIEEEIMPEAPKEPTPPCEILTDKLDYTVKFTLYGAAVAIRMDAAFDFYLAQVNENDLADTLILIERIVGEYMIGQLMTLKEELQLGDWHYLRTFETFSQQLFPQNPDKQTVLTFYNLVQSGYDAKLAIMNNRFVLAMPFREQLYAQPYIEFGELRYYLLTKESGALRTFNFPLPNGRLSSVKLHSAPALPKNTIEKSIYVKRRNKELTARYNRNLEQLYNDYPQCNAINQAQAPMSEELQQTLIAQLKAEVAGLSMEQAANLLINIVQTSFDYKTDTEQFGRQKPFFAKEMFVYPYSDCKDRSVILSQLVRNVLGLEVVLLDYPDHIATAVNFGTEAISGDRISYAGKQFVVCDPTYIGADIGMAMPQYIGVTPIVWRIN